jgi:hypothetical protein
VTLLLQVDGSGHGGEGYRFAVDSDPLTAKVWSRDLYDNPELEGFKFIYDLQGEDIEIQPNCMASKWEDLDTLVGREKILVFSPDGDVVLNTAFREKLAAERLHHERLGASIRRAVQATPRGDMRLVLQGLPGEARALRSEPRLVSDECATIHLDVFEAEADLQMESRSRGPVPVLFARDPDGVKEVLTRHPDRLLPGKSPRQTAEVNRLECL